MCSLRQLLWFGIPLSNFYRNDGSHTSMGLNKMLNVKFYWGSWSSKVQLRQGHRVAEVSLHNCSIQEQRCVDVLVVKRAF